MFVSKSALLYFGVSPSGEAPRKVGDKGGIKEASKFKPVGGSSVTLSTGKETQQTTDVWESSSNSPLPLKSNQASNSQAGLTERKTGFSPSHRARIRKRMKPYTYGKDLRRILSESSFYCYRGNIVLENFTPTDLQSPHTPIGVCQELANDLVKELKAEFSEEKFHFCSVGGHSAKYYNSPKSRHVFILGWTEANHKKIDGFLKDTKFVFPPPKIPFEALLIDPSFKLVEPSHHPIAKSYDITNGNGSEHHYFPSPFHKDIYFMAQGQGLPLGFVRNLIPEVEAQFKDCIYELRFDKQADGKTIKVDINLRNPDGSIKPNAEVELFKKQHLSKIPTLQKLLDKAQREANLPESQNPNKNLLDRLHRALPGTPLMVNTWALKPSFNIDKPNISDNLQPESKGVDKRILPLSDDHVPVIKRAGRKDHPLEWDDSALILNAAEYNALGLKDMDQAKDFIRSLKYLH